MANYEHLPIEENRLQQIIADAKDFVYGQGVVIRSQSSPSSADSVCHAPFTLLPSPVLASCFEQARQVQTDLNLLMHRVATDTDFLHKCLESVIIVDDFTKRLWNICQTVQKNGPVQPIILALNRSDYMIGLADGINGVGEHTEAIQADQNEQVVQQSSSSPNAKRRSSLGQMLKSKKNRVSITSDSTADDAVESNENASHADSVTNGFSLKQIEFNTIAASFGGLSQKLTAYHRFFLSRFTRIDNSKVPENDAAKGLAEGFVTAHRLYGNPSAVILFLVYEVERNIYDHRHLEYAIYDIDSRIQVIRRTLKDLQSQAHRTEDNRLIVDGMEVSIAYLRCGYKPSDYESEEAWDSRLMMESSKAIVCPTSAYQLAGTKKIQQVLATPGVVERFINDPATVRRIRATFVDQYSLNLDEEGDRNAQMAIDRPHGFVLKPQREGGGNNTFGDDIRTKLNELKQDSERSAYILMKKIEPLVLKNYPIASGKDIELREMVSELGIYGSLVAVGGEIVHNKQHGHLLRTKPVGTDEGGVATGYSVLDSPYLVSTWPSQVFTAGSC